MQWKKLLYSNAVMLVSSIINLIYLIVYNTGDDAEKLLQIICGVQFIYQSATGDMYYYNFFNNFQRQYPKVQAFQKKLCV